MFIMMNYKKPKRYFEKSGVVDPKASYYVSMENVTNMDKQDIKTMVDLGEWKEVKGFRTYLIDTDNIIHLISWHQVQNDKELGEALFLNVARNLTVCL